MRPSLHTHSALGVRLFCALAAALLIPSPQTTHAAEPEAVDFNRDIRPILSNHCYACHGPDEHDRQAGLRFDLRESAISELESGDRAIVPEDLKASELVARIRTDDEYTVMPPPEAHKPLNAKQKRLLERWIEQGAEYAPHWAFVTPTRPEVPAVEKADWVRTPIDNYILRKLAETKLTPNASADKRTLIRRVTLDLTGLPPTPEEVEAFVNDTSPTAYETVVDRLLASERYGEHMARYWLDLVRYGDTHGLHLDNYREMWPYRDYVIESFNRNTPFDRFITEQLAGDLLPDVGLREQVASGFNRLNVTTSEGGSIYEEVYVRNVVDRVESFGTIFLGLTTGCAVCHDHKFDPIAMQDFYSLFAYFNSLDGRALDGNKKDHPPVVRVSTPESEAKRAVLAERVLSIQQRLDGDLPEVDKAQATWEESLRAMLSAPEEDPAAEPAPTEPTWAHLIPTESATRDGSELVIDAKTGRVKVTGPNPAKEVVTLVGALDASTKLRGIRLEVFSPEVGKRGAGRSANENAVLTEAVFEVASAADPNTWTPLKVDAVEADYSQNNSPAYDVKYAIDGKFDGNNGWAIQGFDKKENRVATFRFGPGVDLEAGSRVRVKLHFESKYAQHTFGEVRLSTTADDPLSEPELELTTSPWSVVGPFPTEYENAAFGRKVASEGGAFNPSQTFNYRDENYEWSAHPEWQAGQVVTLPVLADQVTSTLLHRSITASRPADVTLLLALDDGFRLYVNGKQVVEERDASPLRRYSQRIKVSLKEGQNDIYLKVVNVGGESRLATALRHSSVAAPEWVQSVVSKPVEQRTDNESAELRSYYRNVVSMHPTVTSIVAEFDKVRSELDALDKSLPTTLIYKELATPRPAYMLKRGQYDARGAEVQRAVPGALPPMNPDWPNDRLGLALWLTSPEHPLTARVAVNRFWQQLFGTGLVKTSEDFGAQGEMPSHPELLDWLAVDFRESGWDVKGLMRLMVLSSTYRQSSTRSEAALERDPENRLLSHGPRHRLDAETLRDQALAVSGLLVRKMGGPSVKPPQPAGLWEAVGYTDSNTAKFKADSGEKIFRRSVYTFWKRTAPSPTMTAFDAPSRESCTARRERTNTPLQALVLLNELQYLDCARNLGVRVLSEGGVEFDPRLDRLFLLTTARIPTPEERDELTQLHADLLAAYNSEPEAAAQLIGEAGKKLPANVTSSELAAWTVLSNLMLNLDEVVSKN